MDDSIIVKAIQYFADWQKFTYASFLIFEFMKILRSQMTGGDADAQMQKTKK